MSEPHNPYFYADVEQTHEMPRTSKLATASLLCSLVLCCPALTIIAPLLGLAAIITIGNNPMLRGKGFAMAGIIIGMLVTLAWGYGGYKAAQVAMSVMTAAQNEPPRFMQDLTDGDYAAAKARLFGRLDQTPDDDLELFITTLQDRYGTYQQMTYDLNLNPPDSTPDGALMFRVQVRFANETRDATIVWAVTDPQAGGLSLPGGILRIVVHDSDEGNVTFP